MWFSRILFLLLNCLVVNCKSLPLPLLVNESFCCLTLSETDTVFQQGFFLATRQLFGWSPTDHAPFEGVAGTAYSIEDTTSASCSFTVSSFGPLNSSVPTFPCFFTILAKRSIKHFTTWPVYFWWESQYLVFYAVSYLFGSLCFFAGGLTRVRHCTCWQQFTVEPESGSHSCLVPEWHFESVLSIVPTETATANCIVYLYIAKDAPICN